jgi:hypothetical protein
MMDVVLYYTEDGKVHLDVHLERETVWLSQRQMAELLDKDTDTIGLHIRNIYNEGELSRKGTTEESSVVQTEGGRQVRRNVNLYNLDVIISVGYRVKSQRGVQFRQWATQTLKQHLIQGYTLNRKRLAQLGTDVDQLMGLMQQTLTQNKLVLPEGAAIADLIRDYARTWQLLLAYDERKLEEPDGQKRELVLDAKIARQAIHQLKTRLKQNGQATDLFGRERDQALDGNAGCFLNF